MSTALNANNPIENKHFKNKTIRKTDSNYNKYMEKAHPS